MLKKRTKLLLVFIAVLAIASCGSDASKSTSSSTNTDGDVTSLSDTESVSADADGLILASITLASGDDAISITQDFTVPISGTNGSTISWTCDDDAISVNVDGIATIVPPANGSGNKDVTCTSTISKGNESISKNFSFTVIELPDTKVSLFFQKKKAWV